MKPVRTALVAVMRTARLEVGNPQGDFWNRRRALGESAAAGRVLQIPPGDTQLAKDTRLVECGETELRFPLPVDENRSRTWVVIRHADQRELRHDHHKADGTEQANTWYGATTVAEATAERQEFVTVRGGNERWLGGGDRAGATVHRRNPPQRRLAASSPVWPHGAGGHPAAAPGCRGEAESAAAGGEGYDRRGAPRSAPPP